MCTAKRGSACDELFIGRPLLSSLARHGIDRLARAHLLICGLQMLATFAWKNW